MRSRGGAVWVLARMQPKARTARARCRGWGHGGERNRAIARSVSAAEQGEKAAKIGRKAKAHLRPDERRRWFIVR